MTNDSSDKPKSRGVPTWLVVVLALVVAWCVYLALFGPVRPAPGELPPPTLKELEEEKPFARKGPRVSYDWTLTDLDGRPVDFAQYKGKLVFLNFWATWCRPCVAELPSIAGLAANPRVRDVVFLCVSTDDDLELVRRFVAAHKIGLTVLLAGSRVPDVFQSQYIPATFMIGRDGRIVHSETGSFQWDNPAVVDRLEELVKAPVESEGP